MIIVPYLQNLIIVSVNNLAATELQERRCAIRYALGWPVVLEGGNGVTRDISKSGVYFDTEWKIQCGTFLEFALVLPERNDNVRYLVCNAQVLRVERRQQGAGIAAKLVRMRFENEILPALVDRAKFDN